MRENATGGGDSASNTADEVAFYPALLAALDVPIAVVDEAWRIRESNPAWLSFLRERGAGPDAADGGEGSFLEVCHWILGPSPARFEQVKAGIQSVLEGSKGGFEMAYPLQARGEQRWFLMRVKPIEAGTRRWLLISQTDVTEASEFDSARQRQEVDALDRYPGAERTEVAAHCFGQYSVRDEWPRLFEEMVARLGELLDAALLERGYRVERAVPAGLRELANDLGHVRARPRDVVDVHVQAMRRKLAAASRQKAQIYLEEGRLLLVELMGYLASYYRNYCVDARDFTGQSDDGRSGGSGASA
jgi:hypothetical protein